MTSRRQFIGLALGTLAEGEAIAQLPPNIAALRQAALDEAIRKVVGDAQVRPGKVKLDLPPLIDNGNTVPLSVTVDSPMTEADHVTAVHIVNQKNPQPHVISVTLGPRAGRARVSTRIKLADSQEVVAIAEMSDGSFWTESADVIVTIAACVEDLVR